MPDDALQNVTARIPPEHRAELRRRAGDRGVSAYIADLIRDHIEGGETRAVLEAIAVLQDEAAAQRAETAALRTDLATVLETLLLNLTTAPPQDIRRFVSEKLRRGGGV